jgi:hypothetical protein
VCVRERKREYFTREFKARGFGSVLDGALREIVLERERERERALRGDWAGGGESVRGASSA